MAAVISTLRQLLSRYPVSAWAALALAAVVGSVIAVLSIRGASEPGVATRPAAADVSVSDCSVSDHGYSYLSTHAAVTVTNSTGRIQSYVTTISLIDQTGARIGEANATTKPLAAGESVTLNAAGIADDGTDPGPARCGPVSAHRFPG